MSGEAFLTGSHAYGIPSADSDVDLVVYMHPEEITKLLKAKNPLGDAAGYASACNVSLRFGNLNLIINATEERYQAWKKGTDELIQQKPVTREQAVQVIKSHLEQSP